MDMYRPNITLSVREQKALQPFLPVHSLACCWLLIAVVCRQPSGFLIHVSLCCVVTLFYTLEASSHLPRSGSFLSAGAMRPSLIFPASGSQYLLVRAEGPWAKVKSESSKTTGEPRELLPLPVWKVQNVLWDNRKIASTLLYSAIDTP